MREKRSSIASRFQWLWYPSSLYRQGKKKFVKLVVQNEKLLKVIQVFMSKDHPLDSIVDAGQKFFVALYGGESDDTLNGLRFQLFAKSMVKIQFYLASLPSTLEAARQHCLRASLQVQMWLGNQKNSLLWGWQTTKYGLVPVTTIKEPAPLLKGMPWSSVGAQLPALEVAKPN